jgi:hypothetical protein
MLADGRTRSSSPGSVVEEHHALPDGFEADVQLLVAVGKAAVPDWAQVGW